MIDLEERLTRLELDVDQLDLVSDVLAQIDTPSTGKRRSWLLVAAAVLVVVTVAIAVVPGSRRTVAGWLGIGSVRVERVPVLDVPPGPRTFDLPGPGETTTVEVDGREILVSTIDAGLDGVSLVKTLGPGSTVEEVRVAGHRGLWISGDDHVLAYPADGSDPVVVAGNTLLWDDGDVLHRVEGFDTLEAAIELAEALSED